MQRTDIIERVEYLYLLRPKYSKIWQKKLQDDEKVKGILKIMTNNISINYIKIEPKIC